VFTEESASRRRVEKQAQEATADEYDHLNVLDKDDDDDDATGTGTRQDVDAMADVGEAAGQEDDQLGLLSEADCDNCTTGDELPVFLTSTRAGKPADAADMYRPLLTPAADMPQAHMPRCVRRTYKRVQRLVSTSSIGTSRNTPPMHLIRPSTTIKSARPTSSSCSQTRSILLPQHGSPATDGSSTQTSTTTQQSPRYHKRSRSMSGSTPPLRSSLPRCCRRFCGKSRPGSRSPLRLAPPTPVEVVAITTLRHSSKTSRF
jgi:hypothetical protein